MSRDIKINLVLVLAFIAATFNIVLADEQSDFREELGVKIAEKLSDPSKFNLSQQDKEFDSALSSVIMLLKRQVCQDFMNNLTKTDGYIFKWHNPDNPVIGLFIDKESASPGCGQINLPIDEQQNKPYPIFNKIVYNTNPQIPGVLQIISQKLTKDIADLNKNIEEIDLQPVYTACVFYNNNISKKPAIKNKFIRSFGEYLPDYPLVIAQNSVEVKDLVKRIDGLVDNVIDNGCDGKRKERQLEAARRAGGGISRGSDIGASGLGSFGGVSGGSTGASGYAGGSIFGELSRNNSGGSNNNISSGAGSGAGFDTGDVTGTKVKTEAGSTASNSSTTGGTISTGLDSSGEVTNGCPVDDPNCQENNNNCPPSDPECKDSAGVDDPTDSGCVANLLGQCIPEVYDSSFYLASTNITRYSPQSGFIYNLPNPGGEYHTKIIRINGQNRLVDLSIPCKASADVCNEIYNRWVDNSLNRQVLHNVELDVYPNLPDQLWVYPSNHFENNYIPFYESALQSAKDSSDPIDNNNKLPYGPLNN